MFLRSLLILILFSCNSSPYKKYNLDEVDKIQVNDAVNILLGSITNNEVVQDFGDVLKGDPEKVDCKPEGSLMFLKGNDLKLKVNYSITSPDCVFLIFNDGVKDLGYRLNYRSGRFLEEYIYKMKK